MGDVLAMGGYAGYVWSSFALTFIVMTVCVIQARTRQSRAYKRIQSRLRSMESKE